MEVIDKFTYRLKLELIKKNLAYIGISLGILIFYKKLFQGYFQGDEWVFFEKFLPRITTLRGLMEISIQSITNAKEFNGNGHTTPLYFLLFAVSMSLFKLNYFFWATTSILIHIANTLLLAKFTKHISHSHSFSIIAAITFAFSAAHQQAVSWMMNHIPTSLSTSFILITLILFTRYLNHKNSSYKQIAFIFLTTIAALFTKENSIIIFPATGLLFLMNKKTAKNKKAIIYLAGLFVAYLLFRFPLVSIIGTDSLEGVKNLTPELFIFRAFAYPLRATAQIIIPSDIVLQMSEKFTSLAYPTYAAEREVRGSNFLLFTQSAGIDIISLAIASVFLTSLSWIITISKYKKTKHLLMFGVLMLITPTIPLIMIALYAPWWGYTSIIDSRHLYLSTIGFSIILATLSTRLLENSSRKATSYIIVAVLLTSWMYFNYHVLQKELTLQAVTGTDRKNILSHINSTLPSYKSEIVVYIKSDSSYYGFGDLMPPFQTNFGQALSVSLAFKGNIPPESLDTSYLTSKGLAGQGYKQTDKYAFGYFLSTKNLLEFMQDTNFPIENLYAFEWKGEEHTINDITQSTRDNVTSRLSEIKKYESWQEIILEKNGLSFKIPPGSHFSNNTIFSNDGNVDVRVIERTGNVGIYEDISLLKNSDNQTIADDFYYRNINMKDSTTITAKVTSKGKSTKYFIPTFWPDKILEITLLNSPSRLNKEFPFLEEIISLIRIKQT